MDGKLGGRGAVAAAAPSGHQGWLALLEDQTSAYKFLVDTGSVYSILPHSSSETPTGPRIMTADKTAIKCWGYRSHVVRAGGQNFTWTFLLAAVAFPIIGADFLRHFRLMVDLYNMRLVARGRCHDLKLTAPPLSCTFAAIGVVADDRKTELLQGEGTIYVPPAAKQGTYVPPAAMQRTGRLPVAAHVPPAAMQGTGVPPVDAHVPPAAMRCVADEVEQLMAEYPGVVNNSKQLPRAKHHVEHVIETTCGRPAKARYRRLDPEKLAAAKADFQQMEQQGIVRRSSSDWASPLHMVRKKDGSWRPCGDYRHLNLATKADLYPPPHMEDLSSKLAGMKIFSTIDLRKGYWQVPVREQDIKKTAVITPFGLFEFCRMPFGLRNAGQTFQRMMDSVLDGMPRVFVYLDDLLIASQDTELHKQDLQQVMKRLQQHGLVINEEKCQFFKKEVDFLGHVVSSDGIRPPAAKVEAIRTYPKPATCSQLLSFLGMLNYYRRFIPKAASMLKPLTDATRGGGAKHRKLDWSAAMEEAFKSARTSLCAAAKLAHPQKDPVLSLAVDASDHHVGGVLQQHCGGHWQPLAFFSRKLTETETRYSTLDRELLACVAAIRHFRYLVEGRQFTLFTDHKPLTYLLAKQADAWSARQQRHLAYVAEYTSDVRHVPGEENVVADALSRPPAVAAIVPPASTGLLR